MKWTLLLLYTLASLLALNAVARELDDSIEYDDLVEMPQEMRDVRDRSLNHVKEKYQGRLDNSKKGKHRMKVGEERRERDSRKRALKDSLSRGPVGSVGDAIGEEEEEEGEVGLLHIGTEGEGDVQQVTERELLYRKVAILSVVGLSVGMFLLVMYYGVREKGSKMKIQGQIGGDSTIRKKR